MSVTVTLHAWWLLAYLGVGAALLIPIDWLAWRSIHNPPPFWRDLWRAARRVPGRVLLTIALWPLALWEVAT